MGKGQDFERQMARKLSLWWSDGKSDDLFWRSSMSGGRATVRAKSGKSTANSCGDLMAMTAEGQSLLDITAFELKKGYQTYSIQDLIDKPNKKGGFWDFVEQASRDASLAGCPHWTVIHKRDRREPVYVTNLPISDYRYRVPGLDYTLTVLPESSFLSPENRQIMKALNA